MAIIPGDICPESIAQIQADLTATSWVMMDFPNLCFIFLKEEQYSNTDMRVIFQDMIDWFEAESWTDNYIVYPNWRRQEIAIGDPNAVAGP